MVIGIDFNKNGLKKMIHKFVLSAVVTFCAISFVMVAASTCMAAGVARADKQTEREHIMFIQQLGDDVLSSLSKPNLKKEQIAPRFRQLLEKNFATETIGRFVLGRYWLQATNAQREEYMELFKNLIVVTYADRFSKYSGEKFEVRSAHPEGRSDYTVLSKIIRLDGSIIDVSWRVRRRNNVLKIVDVSVEGVSMSASQRSEFASIIQRTGSINGLLNTIRERVKNIK